MICWLYIVYIRMSLFHEEWRQEAYHMRSHLHLRDLPENHIKKVKAMPFKFEDYRVHFHTHRQTTNYLVSPTNAPTLSVSTTMEYSKAEWFPNVKIWKGSLRTACSLINTLARWRGGNPRASLRASTVATPLTYKKSAFDRSYINQYQQFNPVWMDQVKRLEILSQLGIALISPPWAHRVKGDFKAVSIADLTCSSETFSTW